MQLSNLLTVCFFKVLTRCYLCLFALSFLIQPCAFSAEKPYWHSVIILFQSNDYSGAYNELQRLLETYPNNSLLLRLKGVCLIELGHYDSAVEILATAIEIDPESKASRYYFAQALAYRGSLVESIAVLKEVIQLAPDSEYAQKSREILPEMENMAGTLDAIQDERRWNLYGRLVGEYDDNVPARANDSQIDTPQDSWKMTYSFYGEVRFPDQKIDTAPFTLGLGYSVNGNEHERREFQAYDLFSQNLILYLSRNGNMLDRFYTVKIEGSYSHSQLDSQDYSEVGGLEASFDYYWHKKVTSKLVANWDNKDFDDDTEYPNFYSRDGDAYNIGLRNHFYLMNNSLVLGLHYIYRIENSEGSQFEIRSNDLTGSVTAYLPWQMRLTGSVTYQQEDYTEFTSDPKRLDNLWTFYTALERKIWKDWLTLEVNYTYSTADSNWDFADYRRNVIGFGLSASY